MATETNLKFRSVFPHEPLPTEDRGWLHIQGAFCPRPTKKKEEGGAVEGQEETLGDYWTRESLHKALTSLLANRIAALGLPFAAEEVQVLDSVAPFTKVRLVYKTPAQALHVLIAWRRTSKLSPSTLFASFLDASFGSRPFQVSQVTQRPVDEEFWNRSNPPKFRRLLARPGEDVTLLQEERATTRFLFLSNIASDEDSFWSDPHIVAHAVRSVIQQHVDDDSSIVEVFVAHAKKASKYCHLGLSSPAHVRKVLTALQEQRVEWKWINEKGEEESQPSGVLFLDHAAITLRSRQARQRGEDAKGEPDRSECTSVTADVEVPGLVLVPDYVSHEEEAALMAVLTGPQAPYAPSQIVPSLSGAVKRRVQHYGYVFDYQTANVLRDRAVPGADCPPMPKLTPGHSHQNLDDDNTALESRIAEGLKEGQGWDVLAGIIERTRRHDFETKSEDDSKVYPTLNQLTVNEYSPGEGIGSHVDTPSAFADGLISISLNSGIVMEFRKVVDKDDLSTREKSEGPNRKLVYLPPRSLLLMSGDARYRWEHMIVTRKTDTHNGEVQRRGTRVSLTLRTALDLNGAPMPLLESADFPPIWGSGGKSDSSPLETPACERDHVHAVYDAIATQWHHTRGKRGVLWPGATQFLQRLPQGSIVADVGCGDGKYFPAIWEAGSYVIGTDISRPLLKTAQKIPAGDGENDVPESRRVSKERLHLRNRPAVAVADCMAVPLRSNSCDAAICIAVLHHLSTKERRRRCLEELARIVKPGGMINIQAWAMEQDESSRRRFAVNDIYVPFNAQPKHLKLNTDSSKNSASLPEGEKEAAGGQKGESTAEVYSKALNAEYDEKKGLVVFKRYCHLYRKGELDEIAAAIPNVKLVESGFESGNYFIIVEVVE